MTPPRSRFIKLSPDDATLAVIFAKINSKAVVAFLMKKFNKIINLYNWFSTCVKFGGLWVVAGEFNYLSKNAIR